MIGAIAGALGWFVFGHGGLDPEGKPIGTDFVSFWTASRLALDGRPELAWDPAAHFSQQQALFGSSIAYARFLYPPPFLAICLPLALLPYFVSLAVWLIATGYAYYRMLGAYISDLSPIAVLAFPAVLINCAHGQNGFLSAALIGGGLSLMNRRPALAGLLFGAMAYKPHLALMLPIALLLSGRRTTLISAAIAAVFFCGISALVFGEAAWRGFFADLAQAQTDMESNLLVNAKMQSAFSATRLLQGPLAMAYLMQALFAAAAATGLYVLRRKAFRASAEVPATACACLMTSPYLFDYDLTLLAIPIVWLTNQGLGSRFYPGEKAILVVAFLLPLISRLCALSIGLPMAPAVIVAVFALVIHRALGGSVETGVSPRPADLPTRVRLRGHEDGQQKQELELTKYCRIFS